MKDIKGFEGLYAITSCGKVWSYRSQKFLKPNTLSKGYLGVDLYKDGQRVSKKIHRLVAEAYIPNPENKPEVNHKDEDKSNNCINNLEWMTTKENINYGTRTQKTYKPVYCVELDKIFDSQSIASNELEIDRTCIVNCLNGRSKTAGGYHWRYIEEE